jgi:ferrous-iron efflux pump FieF
MFFSVKLFEKVLDSFLKGRAPVDLARYSILMAVITAVSLVIIKILAWLMTGSISLQASMSDSFLDAVSSFTAYHALRISNKKQDREHNFGHEKVEGIFAIFQCIIIMFSGVIIFRDAYEMLLDPQPMINTTIGVVVMVISCLATYNLVYFQRYVVKKTKSIIVTGDSIHYLSDFFINLCVILSLVLTKSFVYMDVICGIAVGCYVFYNAILLMKSAFDDLMDKSLPKETQETINNAVLSVDGVISIKALRTRSAGMKKYVEARIIVSKTIPMEEAHKIANNAKSVVKKIFDNADVIVITEV